MKLGIAEERLDAIRDEVAAVIDAATEFAKAGAEPGEASLMTRGLRRRGVVMAELNYREAVAYGIAQEMRRDPNLVMLGEDIAAAGGVFKTTVGLVDEFGPDRVRDTPISEQAMLGAAMGAAMTGVPVIAEIMFSDFLAVCWDIVANEIAKSRYMTNGQVSFPLVIRTANGGGVRFGAQHSQSVENWAMMIPGLKVVAPSTPEDIVGLMAAAIRDPDPVVFFEHKALMGDEGRGARRRDRRRTRHGQGAPRGDGRHDRGARRHGAARDGGRRAPRAGRHLRRGASTSARWCRSTRARCCRRSRRPDGCSRSRRTPASAAGGPSSCRSWPKRGSGTLDGPSIRITTPHVPLPAAASLEDLALPSVDRIYETVSKAVEGGSGA